MSPAVEDSNVLALLSLHSDIVHVHAFQPPDIQLRTIITLKEDKDEGPKIEHTDLK